MIPVPKCSSLVRNSRVFRQCRCSEPLRNEDWRNSLAGQGPDTDVGPMANSTRQELLGSEHLSRRIKNGMRVGPRQKSAFRYAPASREFPRIRVAPYADPQTTDFATAGACE
jgi:hypothetical protein